MRSADYDLALIVPLMLTKKNKKTTTLEIRDEDEAPPTDTAFK